MSKSYHQYCPVAHALDVVGERWSLLVVRELVHGPQRYTDLLERLPGCGTNVLAARLKSLEREGVVSRRRLPPPAASAVYELTDAGRGLEPVLQALARWGLRTLGPPDAEAELPPGWLPRALRTLAPCADNDLRLVVRSEDELASIVGGRAVEGGIADPQATIAGDARALYDLIVEGDTDGVEVDGDPDAVRRFAAAFAEPVSAGATA